MDSFSKKDIKQLLEGYQRRQFTPTQVVDSCLQLLETQNPELNTTLQIHREFSLQRARELESLMSEPIKLPLFGVPVLIKDVICVKGWKTTAASKILENYIAPYTATCVEKLENAGAIVVGKANCDEFAMGSSNENSAYGPVKNPWNLEHVPGGSSGGSAAAVASGSVPTSLGTDTGGSIRQPASLCGIVGMKPTYGRVSRNGVIAFASSLDQVGPFGKTVWDTARTLEVISGYDSKDATSSRSVVPNYTQTLEQTPKDYKNWIFGYSSEFFNGLSSCVLASYEKTLKQIQEMGAKLIDISFPHLKYSLSTYYLIAPCEASSNLARYDGIHYGHRSQKATNLEELYQFSRGEAFGKEVKLRIMLGTYALSSGYYDAYYKRAGQVRRLIQKDFENAFEKCHVIITPTSPTTAFKINEKVADPLTMYLSDVFTLPVSLAGLPAASVPSGLDKNGLPIGMQFIGKSFEESKVLQASYIFEQTRDPLENPPWQRESLS